jgi:hypothetical protein
MFVSVKGRRKVGENKKELMDRIERRHSRTDSREKKTTFILSIKVHNAANYVANHDGSIINSSNIQYQ